MHYSRGEDKGRVATGWQRVAPLRRQDAGVRFDGRVYSGYGTPR